MYDEVRYARISCMSLKPTAVFFCLKRNYKNLTTEEYAENLIAYLSNAHWCKTITVEDLNNVMLGIMSLSMMYLMKPNQVTTPKIHKFQYS